jgi:hypothetical protein
MASAQFAGNDEGGEMRMFVAFVIVLSTVCYWDAEYNYGKLFDGAHSMGNAILHSMRR